MILGMTWLSRYHAIIDCRNKKVIFRITHQPEFQFDGEYKSAKGKTQSVCATLRLRRREYQFGMSSQMYLKRSHDFHPTEKLSSP